MPTNLILFFFFFNLPSYHPSPTSFPSSFFAFSWPSRPLNNLLRAFYTSLPLGNSQECCRTTSPCHLSTLLKPPQHNAQNSTTILQSCLSSLVTTLLKETITALVRRLSKMTTLTSMKSTRAHAQSFRLKSRIASPTHICPLRSPIANLT